MRQANEVREIGRRQLRERLAPLLKQLKESGSMAAVTNRNKVEAFLVPASLFDDLLRAKDDLDDLRTLVPLLIAATTAGAAIPSETLDRAGISLDFDWRRINALQAAFPIRITHDERGERLPIMPRISHHPISESEEELDLES